MIILVAFNKYNKSPVFSIFINGYIAAGINLSIPVITAIYLALLANINYFDINPIHDKYLLFKSLFLLFIP
jgi:hypothetical protein